MSKRFKIIPAIYLVLRNDDKILLCRRFNTGYMDGKYSMIAGHLDGDEPLEKALAREANEEAGITINPDDLKLIHVIHTRSELPNSLDDERVDFYFTAEKYSGELKIMEPNKCDRMDWFDIKNLPEEIVPRVKVALENILKGEPYSSLGW